MTRTCYLNTRHKDTQKLLFGRLPQKQPIHSAKLHWQDKFRQDFKRINVEWKIHLGLRKQRIMLDGDIFVMKVNMQ